MSRKFLNDQYNNDTGVILTSYLINWACANVLNGSKKCRPCLLYILYSIFLYLFKYTYNSPFNHPRPNHPQNSTLHPLPTLTPGSFTIAHPALPPSPLNHLISTSLPTPSSTNLTVPLPSQLSGAPTTTIFSTLTFAILFKYSFLFFSFPAFAATSSDMSLLDANVNFRWM